MRLRRRSQETRGPRLSILRILVAVLTIGLVGAAAVHITSTRLANRGRLRSHWFAPYVDVTLPPYLDFQDPEANPNADVVLAFVVASPKDPCDPSWGGAYSLDEAATALDLDRRLVRLRERGGDALISFGGVANEELANACTDPAKLALAYGSVVDRYEVQAIDLDLEGDALTEPAARMRRSRAIAAIQRRRAAGGDDVAVWVTLPMGIDGLTPDGVTAVRSLLDAGVELAGVNLMAMDYGAGRPASTSFVDASLAGIDAAAGQVRDVYGGSGTVLTPVQAYAKLGVTPMIGQNDELDDRLTVDDAKRLFDGAVDRGIPRFSMWSLNRDVPCGGNTDPAIADNACSGVAQERMEFSSVLGAVEGRPTAPTSVPVERAKPVGRTNGRNEDLTGPYDRWRPRREYDEADKVVWRGQVYAAKWWNVGTQPDARVAHDWDSPWRSLGPVLEGEDQEAVPTTLPDGTYPAWRPKTSYLAGDVVQRLGHGYRAAWATQGADPAADVDNEWESPWTPLTSVAPAGPAPD